MSTEGVRICLPEDLETPCVRHAPMHIIESHRMATGDTYRRDCLDCGLERSLATGSLRCADCMDTHDYQTPEHVASVALPPSFLRREIHELFAEAQALAPLVSTLSDQRFPSMPYGHGFVFFCRSSEVRPPTSSRGARPRQNRVRHIAAMTWPVYFRLLRHEHLAEGLCSKLCRRPVVPGQTRCTVCRAANAQLVRRRMEALKLAGLCQCCGKRPASGSRCEVCLATRRDRDGDRSRLRRTRNRAGEQLAETNRIRMKRAKGLCARCSGPSETYRCEGCRQARRMGDRSLTHAVEKLRFVTLSRFLNAVLSIAAVRGVTFQELAAWSSSHDVTSLQLQGALAVMESDQEIVCDRTGSEDRIWSIAFDAERHEPPRVRSPRKRTRNRENDRQAELVRVRARREKGLCAICSKSSASYRCEECRHARNVRLAEQRQRGAEENSLEPCVV